LKRETKIEWIRIQPGIFVFGFVKSPARGRIAFGVKREEFSFLIQ